MTKKDKVQQTEIELLARKEIPAQEIADQLGISVTRVYQLLSDQLLTIKTATSAKVITYYRANMPVTQIVKLAQISTSTLYRILKSAGIPKRNKTVSKLPTNEIVFAYQKTELTVDEICTKFDIPLDTLYRILEDQEIPRRSTKTPFD